jgi:hypothetical protein
MLCSAPAARYTQFAIFGSKDFLRRHLDSPHQTEMGNGNEIGFGRALASGTVSSMAALTMLYLRSSA